MPPAPAPPRPAHVVAAAPPGPGGGWRTYQPDGLLMNTVAAQVTLFTDATVAAEGPVLPGPGLHEWYESGAPGADGTRTPDRDRPPLGPDDYPTRRLYGEWVGVERSVCFFF
ncbi:FAD/NAD(P)-binding protein, partial [Streptomyces armeniacus]|uniref:FAD/NAD(P)-binding protein n=1 Tax=Streptomyces armeniacus TaxID=83291 RepID=UPI00319E9842